MLSNEEIGNQLKSELEIAISEYKSSNKFKKTEKVFNKLMSYDFDEYKSDLKKKVVKKIKKRWTNPKEGINPEQKLDAILFEHEFPQEKDQKTKLYGIINWKKETIKHVKVKMGFSYDFADGLEQIKGLKTQFFNPFVKKKLGKSYYENGVLITEDRELAKCFQLKGIIAIHEVFNELNDKNAFDKINKNENFHFVFGEHDDEYYLILSI
ncbi:hypothetical protein [Winogradskyella wichelsiae]|uniref:hypothetical protein n=1 Tax=Winogradskyella wichelsiae TaxID=2697007 RepID=UPI0015CDD2C4|nr:hypothetical protein [Winogradskyella wichelsiae]